MTAGPARMIGVEMIAAHAIAGCLLFFYARRRNYEEFAKGIVIAASIWLLLDTGCTFLMFAVRA